MFAMLVLVDLEPKIGLHMQIDWTIGMNAYLMIQHKSHQSRKGAGRLERDAECLANPHTRASEFRPMFLVQLLVCLTRNALHFT